MVEKNTSNPWKGAVAYTISSGTQKLLVVANLTGIEQNNLWFEDFGISNLLEYSLIFGDKDSDYKIESETYEDGVTNAMFKNFKPHEIRVYDLNK